MSNKERTETVETASIKYSNNQVAEYIKAHPFPAHIPEVQQNKLMQIFQDQCIKDFKNGVEWQKNLSGSCEGWIEKSKVIAIIDKHLNRYTDEAMQRANEVEDVDDDFGFGQIGTMHMAVSMIKSEIEKSK
jgi:hypothetical protein